MKRSRSGRSTRARRPPVTFFGGGPRASVAAVDLETVLRIMGGPATGCPGCGHVLVDVGWETFSANWVRVSDDLPPGEVSASIDRHSLKWCPGCDRGFGHMDLDGEHVAVSVGHTCSLGDACHG